jgi:hypothetical protein
MKKHIQIVLIIFILSPVLVKAQVRGTNKGGFSSLTKNKNYFEVIGGIGASNFVGELGGANQIGSHYTLKDMEIVATRTSAQLGFRFKFDKRWAVKGGFYYQAVSGADSLTKEIYRHNRNLSFKSNIFEISSQVEFYFTKAEQLVKRYKIKGAKGYTSFSNIQAYLFMGFGGFFFNPKAEYNGKWVALQPLGTEGQGLPGAPHKYSRFSVCIPIGFGIKQPINKKMYVGLEFGFRKTFTDYIDDVSNTYYDNNAILSARGTTAAYLADPKLYAIPLETGGPYKTLPSANQGGPGAQRGDVKDYDSYMFINVTFSYKIPTKKLIRRKQRSHF